ncbi:hypothetical protein VNO78_22423 [Psophocarpus tetragonolobus]|uniref:Uncharacterized protein n=1 Tax=Psophocarpus tetragonolobus TaxID=3891 RepID=A0AAN9S2B7_PSOTE
MVSKANFTDLEARPSLSSHNIHPINENNARCLHRAFILTFSNKSLILDTPTPTNSSTNSKVTHKKNDGFPCYNFRQKGLPSQLSPSDSLGLIGAL